MATIINLNGDAEILTGYDGIRRTRRVNGEKEIDFTLHLSEQNEHYFHDIGEVWRIEHGGLTYVVDMISDQSDGDSYTRKIGAVQDFYWNLRNTYRYDTFSGSRTFNNMLSFIFNGTGYTFNITGGVFLARDFENFGDDSVLSLLTKAIERYQAEFEVNGKSVTFKPKIGNVTDFQYRYQFNINSVTREKDAVDFSTYGEGFGKDGLHVTYTSPLADVFGKLEAPAVRDERFTNKDTLLAEVKERIDSSLNVSITFDFEDLRASGYPNNVPNEGDTVLLFDERMNIAVDTRIVEIVELFDEDENIVSCDVTLSNFSNFQTQEKRMQKATKAVADAIEGKRPLPFEALDVAVQQATLDLQSAQTELVFDNGIIAIEKTDPNKLVLFNSGGLGISEDGGATFKTAVTGSGIVADVINVGTLRSIIIDSVEIYGSHIYGTEIYGGKFETIDTSENNSENYIRIESNQLRSHGYQTRTWAGEQETALLNLGIRNGQIWVSNEDNGRNLYMTERGLSTTMSGAAEDYSAGTIEFHSQRFNEDSRGISIMSSFGAVALLANNSTIYSRSKLTNNIESDEFSIYIRPRRTVRPGDNDFRFDVKDNAGAADTDGVIQYAGASGLRFSKDSNDPALYATNGNGDLSTGDFHARHFYTHGDGMFHGDVIGSIVAVVDNAYAMVDGEFRVTDKNGNNNGNPNYMDIRVNNVMTASSEAFKQDIVPWDDDALSMINKSKLYKWRRKTDVARGITDKYYRGLVVERETPKEVIDGKGINQYEMNTMSWRAIQQLNTRVDGANTALGTLSGTIDTFGTSLTNQAQQLSQFQTKLAAVDMLSSQVSGLSMTVNGFDTRITSVSNALGTTNNNVTALSDRVTALEQRPIAPSKYVNGTKKTTQQIEYEAVVTTDANGVATLYPTSNGTATGTAIFKTIHSVNATAEFNTSDATVVRLAGVKAVATDNKRIDINVVRGQMITLLGLTPTTGMGGQGVKVYVTIHGE